MEQIKRPCMLELYTQKSDVIRVNIKKPKTKMLYFILPSNITKTIRGTEQFILGLAAYLSNYLNVTVLEPSNYNVNSNKLGEIERKYSKLKLSKIKMKKIKLPFGQYIFSFKGIPKDGIVYLPFDFFSEMPALLSKPKRQIYILGVAHGLHLRNGKLAHHGNIGKIVLCIAMALLALKGRDFKNTVYYHTHNNEQSRYLLRAGLPKKHIFQIPTFIDVKEFYITNNKSKKLKVLHIGGVNKNADFVVKIIDEMITQKILYDYEFHFIGREMPKRLKDLSRIYKNIIIHGFIDNKTKARIMSSVDVLLLTDIETFSVTMLEGLASGLHIISSDGNPAAYELKKREASVYICKHDNINDYVEILGKISRLKKSNTINSFRNKNRRITVHNYSKEAVLKKTLLIFRSIIYKSKLFPASSALVSW